MNRRIGVILMIAVIIGVFAYSTFVGVQRDQNTHSLKSVGD